MRKAAGYRADGRNAAPGEIPDRAGCGCAGDDQKRTRYFGGKATKNKDKGEDSYSDEQGRQMDLGQPAAHFEELEEGFV
jgi:hypothetical protein